MERIRPDSQLSLETELVGQVRGHLTEARPQRVAGLSAWGHEGEELVLLDHQSRTWALARSTDFSAVLARHHERRILSHDKGDAVLASSAHERYRERKFDLGDVSEVERQFLAGEARKRNEEARERVCHDG